MLSQANAAKRSKQPKGLYLLFFIELWERYGFYSVIGSLVLFMSKKLHVSDHHAYELISSVVALLYMSPVLGGYLADRFISLHQSLITGAILLFAGYIMLAIPNIHYFDLGLAMLVVGMGLFKFVPSTLLGKLYDNGCDNMDGGYTLFYMGINIGSFLAFIASGYLARSWGWHLVYFISSIGVLIGLSAFLWGRHKYLKKANNRHLIGKKSILTHGLFYAGIVLAIAACQFIISRLVFAKIVVIMISVLFVAYVAIKAKRLPQQQKKSLFLAMILSGIAIAFFILYCQVPMTVTLFTDRNINHQLLGINIPTAAFQSLNPFWIIALSPLLAKLYKQISASGFQANIIHKYGLGIIMMGLGYLILVVGGHFHDINYHLSPIWLISSYALQSLAELLVSALGLAMIARFSPPSLAGVMMGGWFIIQAIGSLIAGYVSKWAAIPQHFQSSAHSLAVYRHCFSMYGILSVMFGVFILIIAPYLAKLGDDKKPSLPPEVADYA